MLTRTDPTLVPAIDARGFATLQAALTYAGTLGVAVDVVARGSYALTTTLTIPAKVRLLYATLGFTGEPDSTDAAVKLNGDGATIERCTVNVTAGDYRRSIAHRASNTATRDCTIAHTTSDVPTPTSYQSGEAVYCVFAASTEGSEFRTVVIEGNDITFSGHFADGVQASYCPGIKVLNNHIHDGSFSWTTLADIHHLWGIYVAAACQGATVQGNTVANWEGSGVHFNTGGSDAFPTARTADYGRVASGNTITTCGGFGLSFSGTNGAKAIDNHIASCNVLASYGTIGLEALDSIVRGNTYNTVDLTAGTINGAKPMVVIAGDRTTHTENTIGARGAADSGIQVIASDRVKLSDTYGPTRPRFAVVVDSSSHFGSFVNNILDDTDHTAGTAGGCVQIGGDDWIVEGNSIIHNVAGGGSWFALRQGGDRATIRGNRIKAGRSIFFPSGGDTNTYESNDETGSASGPSSSGSGNIIRGRRGYVTVGSGVTSVADGGTISHGLATTPNRYGVTPTVAGEMASVTAVSSTTITVALKKPDGSAGTTQNIAWWVEVA